MPIVIDIPNDLEQQLREANPRLDSDARDQFIIGQYQAGRISTGHIAMILGFDTRYQAEQWLGERGVEWNYDEAALEQDRKTLDELFAKEPA